MADETFVFTSILRDMSEGVMTIGLDGKIKTVNPAALKILEKDEDIIGFPFAMSFFEFEENDEFNQSILDAVYDRTQHHERFVSYFTGEVTKQLHVTTSYLMNGEEKQGVIAVLSDISELVELRDAIKAMEKIKALNSQLEMRNRLISETFGRYLSDDIVKQLLETPDGLSLGGKKAELTVLMSDLRGFTALSERMPAQELLTMLNHYLAAMTEIIQDNNGTIIEFIGDGIMAIFGAPNDNPKHAEDAVRAAVLMQHKMIEINEWNQNNGYPTIEMGIGLNTGDVIVGNIGSERRTKYGITGSNVNLAGRIESYTVGGQVLIAPTTKAQITKDIKVAGEFEIMPKGVNVPLTISDVVGIDDITCEKLLEETKPLGTPKDISFIMIKDKHGEDDICLAQILAISKDQAIIKTSAPLKVFDNIQIDIGEKLFAKVKEEHKEGFVLRFTARPESFEKFLNSLK